jgi:outer membrane protein TolC
VVTTVPAGGPLPDPILVPAGGDANSRQRDIDHDAELPPARKMPESRSDPSSFAAQTELSVEVLVAQVLARNPTLAEMDAAWQAATTRYAQVISLEDPMIGVQLAPGAWWSRDLDGGVRVEVSQKYPWHGKLELRGENAQAQANAAAWDFEDMKLQLIESTVRAFYDYYLVDRALAVNTENLRLLRQFRGNAEKRYETGAVTQQDILQADVEIGRAQERQVMLERLRPVTVARINTLLHLPPDGPLPPPPEKVELRETLPDASLLRTRALEARPDLKAQRERIRAEQASLGLAHQEFYPDMEVMAAYDSIWQEKPLRAQVGVRVNLPVRTERRHAAVNEAEARLAQNLAGLARLTDQVGYQVQQALEQARESEQVASLYQKTILPTARQNVKAAQSAYVTGKIPFLSLIEAQRNVVSLQDRYYEALAEYHRRRATLERVVGVTIVPGPAR